MPWTDADAQKFTKKAATPLLRREWAAVANAELAKHGNEGLAIRAANSAVKHYHERHGMTHAVRVANNPKR